MVFVPPRPRHESTSRCLCDRSRRRAGGDAQSNPSSASFDSDAVRRPWWSLSDRRDAESCRTDVRPTERTCDGPDQTGDWIEPAMSACESGHHTGETPGHADDVDDTMSWTQRRIHGAIIWYQRLREGRPSPCRFYPTCSSYALEAFDTHGTMRGGWLTFRRLVRCRPLGTSGVDPVPPARQSADSSLRPPQKGS